LSSPHGLAVDCADALYIADHLNHRVRKVAWRRWPGCQSRARWSGGPPSAAGCGWRSCVSPPRTVPRSSRPSPFPGDISGGGWSWSGRTTVRPCTGSRTCAAARRWRSSVGRSGLARWSRNAPMRGMTRTTSSGG
jgi:hypothetical protein